MDELKLLIEMVANLPSLAVWVLLGYLVYKVAVIGSIYGVIRLAITMLHSAYTKRSTELVLDGNLFDDNSSMIAFRTQLERLMFIGKSKADSKSYASKKIYHEYGVKYLREAIDKMEEIARAESAK
jgi:uncharacterized membrane protein YcgQ (UPF0703/DUF1980 family)